MAKPALPGNELAQLRDIHLPDAISWWPPAPGWFILALLVMILLGVGVFFVLRTLHHHRSKRKALRLLAQYQREYPKPINAVQSCARLSELLKRVALAYFPRSQVAPLRGQAWVEFLTQTSRNLPFNTVSELLTELPFQTSASSANASEEDVLKLFTLAQSWIQQRRGRCLN